jgi:hypothetical protein
MGILKISRGFWKISGIYESGIFRNSGLFQEFLFFLKTYEYVLSLIISKVYSVYF